MQDMKTKKIFGITILVIFCSFIFCTICYKHGLLNGSLIVSSAIVSAIAIVKAVSWIID